MGKLLYTTQFGSRLFGTSTPNSDTDIKHIELPDIQGLLVGRPLRNRVLGTNSAPNTKNSADDIDTEFIPLQVFARDFYEGQTYALEIAFSIEGTHAGQTHYDAEGRACPMDPSSLFCQFVAELKSNFLTSNIKAMMGYVVNQANIYSFKGARLNCARAVKTFLLSLSPGQTLSDGMADPLARDRAEALSREFPKYFSESTYDISNGRFGPCFKLLEKTIPWSIKADAAAGIVGASVKKYGQRADAASADNVDWKATMHAVRIVDEGIALMTHRRIVLPHPPQSVQRLLAIRRGEIPLETIKNELDQKLERLMDLSAASGIPPLSTELNAAFDLWLERSMMRFYGLATAPKPSNMPKM